MQQMKYDVMFYVAQNADLKQMYAQSDWFNQIKVG